MDICIERCMTSCFNCFNFWHLQYEFDNDYYSRGNIDQLNRSKYNDNTTDTNQKLVKHLNTDEYVAINITTKSPINITNMPKQTQTKPSSLEFSVIPNYKPSTMITNDFIIDLPMLRIDEEDDFELIEKNE